MRFILTFLVCLVCSPTYGAAHALMGAQYNPLRTEGATLKVWTDPHSPLNTLNGDTISELYDLSGNGNRLTNATAANQPALTNSNGRIVAYFDGVNDYLKAATFPLVQPTSVFMGLKQVTWTDADYIADGFSLGSAGVRQATTSPSIKLFAGTSSSANVGLGVGSFGILTALFSGATSSIQVNQSAAIISNAGSNTAEGFTLGSRADATFFSNIETSDILVFQGAPSEPWQRYNILGLARLNGVNPFAP